MQHPGNKEMRVAYRRLHFRRLCRRLAWVSLISAGIVFDAMPGFHPAMWDLIGAFVALAGLWGMLSCY